MQAGKKNMTKGFWHALGAYGLWGLLPMYWKWLHPVPAVELISHRILWSCVFLGGVIFFQRGARVFASSVSPKILGMHALAAALIGINWLTYVWAVNAGFIVETSLGYFINPLISVLLGLVFLGERLRRWQWIALGLALAGVLYLTTAYGSLPWIALTLAFSFGLYGLVKKIAPLGSVHGLTVETGLLFVPALFYVIYVHGRGGGAFIHLGLRTDLLLAGTGLVTTIPLLLFASAAQRIPLSLMGLLQYIAPTLQLLLGVLVFGEPFSRRQFTGFGMVWIALMIFGTESLLARRARTLIAIAD